MDNKSNKLCTVLLAIIGHFCLTLSTQMDTVKASCPSSADILCIFWSPIKELADAYLDSIKQCQW